MGIVAITRLGCCIDHRNRVRGGIYNINPAAVGRRVLRPTAPVPTGIVAITTFVAVLITETVLDWPFVTYAKPVKDGVAVIVAVTGAAPVLTAVNAGILPFPEAARPIDGALFVQ